MYAATYGYREEDIVMLTDDSRNPRQIPTNRNIVSLSSNVTMSVPDLSLEPNQIEAMRWLVRDAKPNDSLFFHCTLISHLC